MWLSSVLRWGLHLLLCVSCYYCRTPQAELDQVLLLFRNSPKQQVLTTPVQTTVHLLVNTVKDRLQCVQQGLTNNDCSQCLSVPKLLRLSSLDSSEDTTNSDDVKRLSVVLLYHVINLKSVCKSQDGVACRNYKDCKQKLFEQFGFDKSISYENQLLETVEDVLRNIQAVYEPLHRTKCYSAESILMENNSTRSDFESESFENLIRSITGHIIKGDCIDVGEAVTDFMEHLFYEYGDKCANVITMNGIDEILQDLKNPPTSEPDSGHNHDNGHNHHDHKHHDHGHNHDEHDNHDHDHHDDECNEKSDNRGKENKGEKHYTYSTSYFGSSADDYSSLGITESNFHATKRSKHASDRQKRSVIKEAKHGAEVPHEHKSLAEKCLDTATLLQKFGQAPYHNITRNEFLQLCPALIQQVVSGVCRKNTTKALSRPSTAELYGYSSLAVFVISLCALGGIFLLPIMAKKAYHYIMMGFIGLSFGTMAGDALLHLMPQAIGLHSHDHAESDEPDVGVTLEGIPFYLWRQLGVVGAIYCLFLFETIMELINNKDGQSHGHGHSHVPEKIPDEIRLKSVNKTESTTNLALQQSQNVSISMDAITSDSSPPQTPVFKSSAICCGLTSLAMVVTLGDAVHNFGDGLAIGAAFSSGLQGGLSTSLAVFCHELPHEFGDFVVLVSTGLSFWKALLVNFISALFCFGGLYIGIQLGENAIARGWILTVTAGIFLYVALVDMLPELKQAKHGNPLKMLLVKNIGVLAGIAIMMMIAIYEDHLHI